MGLIHWILDGLHDELKLLSIFPSSGSVILKCLPMSFVSATIAGLFTHYKIVDGWFGHPYIYSMFAVAITVLITFRTNVCYRRFWEGRTQISLMTSKWGDVTLQALAFDAQYDINLLEDEPRRVFKMRLIHLMSLLHALALLNLRQERNMQECCVPFSIDSQSTDRITLQVIGGLSEKENKALTRHPNRVFVVLFWVTQHIMARHKNGGLRCPAPILSRMFQELSNGMLGFSQALKLVDTPVPFPFNQLTSWMLFIFALTNPIIVCNYTLQAFVAVSLCFFVTLCFYAIDHIARELENTFGIDPNDLQLSVMHAEFNKSLDSLVANQVNASDELSEDIMSPHTFDSIIGGSINLPDDVIVMEDLNDYAPPPDLAFVPPPLATKPAARVAIRFPSSSRIAPSPETSREHTRRSLHMDDNDWGTPVNDISSPVAERAHEVPHFHERGV